MHFFFIANRFLNSNKGIGQLTGKVSTLGIAIGCFALIIAVSVLNGFKSQLDNKIKDFEGDIKISGFQSNEDVSVFDVFNEIFPNSRAGSFPMRTYSHGSGILGAYNFFSYLFTTTNFEKI